MQNGGKGDWPHSMYAPVLRAALDARPRARLGDLPTPLHECPHLSAALGGPSVSVQTRMGIDTGVVVVGNVGDDLDAELAVIGDPVNVAERLEGLAQPGAILVSDATARSVAGYVWLEPVGEVQARGRSAPVVAHRVVGVGPRRSPLEGLGSLPLGRFVGRERHMAALAEADSQSEPLKMTSVVSLAPLLVG